MAQDKPRVHYRMWFAALLLLDAFVFGGLVVWRLVLNLLESKMVDPLPPAALDTLTGIDHMLFPYWFGHTVLALALGLVTIAAYAYLRVAPRRFSFAE